MRILNTETNQVAGTVLIDEIDASSAVPSIVESQHATVVAFGQEFAEIRPSHLRSVELALLQAIEQSEHQRIIVDLCQVSVFCSEFIGVLIRVFQRFRRERQGKLSLCGMSATAVEVLEVTKVDRIWDLFESREQALEAIAS